MGLYNHSSGMGMKWWFELYREYPLEKGSNVGVHYGRCAKSAEYQGPWLGGMGTDYKPSDCLRIAKSKKMLSRSNRNIIVTRNKFNTFTNSNEWQFYLVRSVQYSRMRQNGILFCTFSRKVYTQKINNIYEIQETKSCMCTWIFLVSSKKFHLQV